jgi:phosphoribosylformylglycinamidine cyclo-ligase
MTTYAESGVNIEFGDDVSKILYNAAKATWKNRKGRLGEIFTPFDDFTGLRVINVGGLPEDTVMCLGFDGVGTKMEIGERIGKHDTVAYDLLAMVCDDAVVRGGEPVLVGSILDVRSLSDKDKNPFLQQVRQLATGYVQAADAARVAIINGEVAELGARVSGYGDFNYNWGAGCVWFARKERLLTGKEIRPGQHIVSLLENGLRSNGLSLARKIARNSLGENWHETKDGQFLAEHILEPSKIYCAAVCDMNGGTMDEPKAHVTGVAHITGGGIPGKLGRALKPSGYGALLNNLGPIPLIMHHLIERGNVQDTEAYKTWNMGHGMLIITDTPDDVMRVAKEHNLEHRCVGTVTKEPGITLHAYNNEGLEFKPD